MTAIALALAAVLSVLASLHVFWAIRGNSGESIVIPKVAGKPAFVPTRATTWLVAAALFCAAWLALLIGRVVQPLPVPASEVVVQWAAIAAGCVFLLRAVGDFRLVGFWKRVRGTDFARWDTWCFSPLCVLIGSAYLYLATR